MKNINKISSIVNKTSIWLFVMLLSISTVFAQDALPDAPVDDPAAPIDDFIPYLAIIGIIVVFMRFRALKAKEIQRQNRTF